MARTITFDATYEYPAATIDSPVRRPRVPVRLTNPADTSRHVELNILVDTGADGTSLPLVVAGRLGIELSRLARHHSRGVGGRVATYYHPGLILTLAGYRLAPCPVMFTEMLDEVLLGRHRVFHAFTFAIEQSAWKVHVRTPRQ